MDKYTLVTGASEGLGVEFARLAAKDGRNVILTARSTDKLEALAKDLRSDTVDVVVIPADLSDLSEAAQLWSAATDGRIIDILVNNAGLGYNGPFSDPQGWERELASMQVNMLTYTYLMKQAIPHMESYGGGRIMNVASTGGFMAGPGMAVYHASKAFALHLSEAVATELRNTNVTVTALCPGATATNFFEDADMHAVRLLKFGAPMKADVVAQDGWAKAFAGKRIVVPGVINKVFANLPRFAPRALTARVSALFLAKS